MRPVDRVAHARGDVDLALRVDGTAVGRLGLKETVDDATSQSGQDSGDVPLFSFSSCCIRDRADFGGAFCDDGRRAGLCSGQYRHQRAVPAADAADLRPAANSRSGIPWVPGFWAWDGSEYYWTPGYWQEPPQADLYWTPGYWAWNPSGNDYVFNSGYWGPEVGYYGGINYGFGYTGAGYRGGYWRNKAFVYNRAVNNLGTAKVPTFANQVTPSPSHASFNGGERGTTAKPTEAELAAAHANHVAMTAAQVRHQEAASRITSLRYRENKGSPPVTATPTANDLHGASRSELPLAHGVAGAPAGGPRADNASRPLAPAFARHRNHGPVQGMRAVPATAPNFAIHGPSANNRAFANPALAAPGHTRVTPPPPIQNFAAPAHGSRFGALGGGFHGAPAHVGAPNVRIAIPSTPSGAGMPFGNGMHIGEPIGAGPHIGTPNVRIAIPSTPSGGAGMHFGNGMHIGAPNIGAGPHIGTPNVRIAIPSTPSGGAGMHFGNGMHVGAPNIGAGMHIGGGMHTGGFHGGAIGTPAMGGFRAP